MNYYLAHVLSGFLPLKRWRRDFRAKYCHRQPDKTFQLLEACVTELRQLSMRMNSRKAGKDKVSVVFLLHNVAAIDAVLPVIRRMQQDARYDVMLAAIDHRFPGDNAFSGGAGVEQFFKAKGWPVVRLFAYPDEEAALMLRALLPEVVFRQSPWDRDIKAIYSTASLMFTRLAYIPYYGVHICSTIERNGQVFLHEDQLLHRLAWKVFLDAGAAAAYRERNGLLARNLVICDSPKYEYIDEALDKYRQLEGLERKNGRKRVVWAPHHSCSSQWLGFGTFRYVWRAMMDYVRLHEEISFVFRPHPAFRQGYVSAGGLSEKEMNLFWRQWESLPNTEISNDGNAIDLFKESDALITDGVSFLVSYQLTGKPLIWTVNPDHVDFTEVGQAAADSCYQVDCRHPEMLAPLLDQLLEKSNDPKVVERERFVKTYLKRTEVLPSQFICDYVAEAVRVESDEISQRKVS